MIRLIPHPSTPADAWHVSALAERTPEGELRLRYVVGGALDEVLLPPPGPVRRGDRLWEHTCAEAFVGAEGSPAYVELNFSPSRAWAAYAFAAYREGGPLAAAAAALAPRLAVRRDRDTLTLDLLVALADLTCASDVALRVGLSMVVETLDGLSYWALHHPSAKPDFHHADGFTLRLPPSPSGHA